MNKINLDYQGLKFIFLNVLNLLRINSKLFFILSFFSFILSISYYISLPIFFKVESLVSLATVAKVEVESPLVLIEKVKSNQYLSADNNPSCMEKDEINLDRFLSERFFIKFNKTTNSISVSVISKNYESAIDCLYSILNNINANQEASFSLLLNIHIKKFDLFNKEFNIVNNLQSEIPNTYKNNFEFRNYYLFKYFVDLNKSKLEIMEKTYDLQSLILEPYTQKNKFISHPSIKKLGRDPLKIFFSIFIAFSGFLVAFLYLLLRSKFNLIDKFNY
jgi:hypothetical protein